MARITTHPGDMLYNEFMVPYKMSARELARHMDVPANRVTDLIRGRRSLTADSALRLEKVFGMSAEFWLRLQASHDESVARANDYSKVTAFEGANDNATGAGDDVRRSQS